MSEKPVVGIVMGSDSDWPVMKAAAEALDEFEVRYEADVVSAHRMPHEMLEYGTSADRRGLRVIIAGAGGAAHLPGMLASVTPLPVIGVPVPLAITMPTTGCSLTRRTPCPSGGSWRRDGPGRRDRPRPRRAR